MDKKFVSYPGVEKERYMASEDGILFDAKRNREMKVRTDKDGYKVVNLWNENGKQQTYKIHRIVAFEFCENDNPGIKTQINHKNENKADNRAQNLEWCTPRHNINYGTKTEKVVRKREVPVIVRNTANGDVMKFDGMNEASRVLGIDEARISDVVNGKRKSTQGYEIWAAESPVYGVIPVPVEKIEANDYNPNKVAAREMELLYRSIKEDKYTMPIVCFHDKERDKYIIVDGFHRYATIMQHRDIYEREHGCLPVSVIDKDINDRMASTIRHNRARGKHDVELQSELVAMLKDGWDEPRIMKELGMTLEEVQRLLGLTGIFTEIRGVPFSIEKQIVEAGEDMTEEELEDGKDCD